MLDCRVVQARAAMFGLSPAQVAAAPVNRECARNTFTCAASIPDEVTNSPPVMSTGTSGSNAGGIAGERWHFLAVAGCGRFRWLLYTFSTCTAQDSWWVCLLLSVLLIGLLLAGPDGNSELTPRVVGADMESLLQQSLQNSSWTTGTSHQAPRSEAVSHLHNSCHTHSYHTNSGVPQHIDNSSEPYRYGHRDDSSEPYRHNDNSSEPGSAATPRDLMPDHSTEAAMQQLARRKAAFERFATTEQSAAEQLLEVGVVTSDRFVADPQLNSEQEQEYSDELNSPLGTASWGGLDAASSEQFTANRDLDQDDLQPVNALPCMLL